MDNGDMISSLPITDEFIMKWIIVFLLLVIAGYTVIPKLWKVFNHARNKVNYGEDLVEMVEQHDADIKEINKKLARDFGAINDIRDMMNRQKKAEENSLEEREIIMRSMLAVLKGLQEIGGSGTTPDIKEAQSEIEKYINKQAHEPRG